MTSPRRDPTWWGLGPLLVIIMLGAISLNGCLDANPPDNDPATGVCNRPTSQLGC